MAAALALTGARRYPVLAAQVVAAALILAAWQALAVSGLLFRDVVPGLPLIALALARTLGSAAFWADLAVTAREFALAVGIGGVLGIACGLALGASRFLAGAYQHWVYWLAPTPKIIFFPVLLMLFGAGPESKVAMGAISCFFPVAISVAAGVRGVDPVLVRVGRSLRASALQMALKIYLPAVRAAVLNGFRLGFGVAAIGVLLAETKLSKAGIGFRIMDAYRLFDMPAMYALLILVALLIAGLNTGLALLSNRKDTYRNRGRN
jgi:ABC-type nitrate/sulfonate/bicarbonate transport system permease component